MSTAILNDGGTMVRIREPEVVSIIEVGQDKRLLFHGFVTDSTWH